MQRGDITIYISLVMLLIVTSAALIVTGLLAKQPFLSREIVKSEQAFYTANSGLEHALYLLLRQGTPSDDNSPIESPLANGTYRSYASIKSADDVCASSEGTVGGSTRVIQLGDSNVCEFDE